ncbi:meckelin [Sitodiplosis mosellana]|uniref:meckelin n=1 Tax=Sitodiplosis mosellana TaxID=263140 RepID=UPI002444C987|nr:meckelin [Sitodiplosis mosellana]
MFKSTLLLLLCVSDVFVYSPIKPISANENTVFLYNHIEHCKSSEYYDVNYFMCRECDPQLNLMPSTNGLSCVCNRKSTTKVEYDTNLRQPICSALNCTNVIECNIQFFAPLLRSAQPCGLEHLVEVISTSPPSKSIQIQRIPAKSDKNQTTNLTCPAYGNSLPLSAMECVDPKNYVRFGNYCVPTYLLKDFLNYKQFKVNTNQASVTAANDLFKNLEFLVFLCQTMKMVEYCEHVANLCVLTVYNLEKFSPCNIFYGIQTTFAGTDSYQTKLVPFLFYAKGRSISDDLDKVIDYRYRYFKNDATYDPEDYGGLTQFPTTNRISMLLVAHELNGELKTIQPLKLDDLNLCGMHQQQIKFGENLASACQIDLRSLIEMGERKPWFLNLFLNYTENNINLVKAVPILIRNAFTYNMNPYDRDKWQLVKRFFMIDTLTGRNRTYRPNPFAAENIFEKYMNIRYVKNVELQFHLNENHYYFGNKITVPLLIVEYAYIDMRDFRWANNLDIDFEFRVTFAKDFNIGIFLHILFTMALAAAFGMAIFQTLSFKRRKQQNEFDSFLLVKFLINCCSTLGTVLFASAAFLTVYIYFIYKSQNIVKVLPPFGELKIIKFFFILSFVLKIIKFCHHLGQQINCDIFFIDWERPRVFEHQITLKSTNNLDTPSICSSARQYQQNDGLSAWRMYFVANEWIKLSTKRKCSIGIQILMVLLTIIVFRFDWAHLFSFKSIFHWPWTPDADRIIRSGRALEMLAIGLIIYSVCYAIQRLFNFIIYERYILNSVQQFIDICSMSNISMFIFAIDSYGYYIHGRSPHGFADTDMCSMLQQLRRESENMCGHRGLLPNSEHQTFCFLAPLQLRTLYNKLKSTLRKSMEEKNGPQNYQQNQPVETVGKFFEQNLEQIAHTNTTINRFLSAFIDHGLKDLDYIIQEKSILENIFDFEFDSNVTENRGTFYMDNGHSFDSILFYGNEQILFQIEILLFLCVIVICGNFLFAILFLGIASEILKHTMRLLVKKNLSNQTLIDERFLI